MRSTIVAATALAMALLAPAGPAWAAGPEAQVQLKGPCCVGGTWTGAITQVRSRTCPEPAVGEPFTFAIAQDARCGESVSGKVTTAGGKLKTLTGTVKPLKNGCCRLAGSLATPADPTEKDALTIDFCLVDRVLVASGKATSTSGMPPAQRVCEGSFTMSRVP